MHVNSTAADTGDAGVFSFNDQNGAKSRDLYPASGDVLSNTSSEVSPIPEMQDDSAADEINVTHHVVLTNGPLDGAIIEMNGHSDAIAVDEAVESTAEKKVFQIT